MACVLLSLAVAGGELTLRLRGSAVVPGTSIDDDQLTEPCGVAYRRLRRLQSTTTHDPDTGEPVTVAVNSHGLRGPEVAVPKPAGVYRVLCLGDETILGRHVDEPHAMPARLQQLLQAHTRLRVEVLNGGVPGDCPLLAWLRLRHSLLGLQPDLIVLHVDMTDVEDDRRRRRDTRLDASSSPIACPHPFLVRSQRERPWWRNLQLTEWLVRNVGTVGPSASGGSAMTSPVSPTAWLRENPPDWNLYVEQSLSPLEQIQQAADGVGAVVVVATCPQPWQVSADASAEPGVREAAGIAPGLLMTSRRPFDAIVGFAHARNIPCCDTSTAFRECPEPARLYLRNAPVLSRLGHELYARVLSQFLARRLAASQVPGRSPRLELQESSDGGAASPQPGGVTISFGDDRR
ncbi:MAG: SGNH/GDSL hydrolase family protein [Planctomycetaceae bacterium]